MENDHAIWKWIHVKCFTLSLFHSKYYVLNYVSNLKCDILIWEWKTELFINVYPLSTTLKVGYAILEMSNTITNVSQVAGSLTAAATRPSQSQHTIGTVKIKVQFYS